MHILVINGSPKGERSNTYQLTRAFLEGIQAKEANTEVRERMVSRLSIKSCLGCFACWNKTPGVCVHKDDMPEILESMLWADTIIWSFPLYYFSVPGPMKNLIDRQLPLVTPFMADDSTTSGSGSHDTRFDMSGKRYVLISTCGFYSADKNYDSVLPMFDHFCGKGNYETIFCGQGELFRVPELRSRTGEYLQAVKSAGEEFACDEKISAETRQKLSELLFPREVFETMADASWGIEKSTGEKEDPSLSFTRQMAALYNKKHYDGKDRVLEICYTDLGKTYQILLSKEGSQVLTDGSLTATTRIDTPWAVWGQISRGELSGSGALAKGLYSVSGDFDLMIHWDDFFGSPSGETKTKSASSEKETKLKNPSLTYLLIPWITFWVAVSISAPIGSMITIAVCALLPIVLCKTRLIFYDKLSLGLVTLLSVLSMQSGCQMMAILLGYLFFGLIWLLSCFTKEPLCAAYVKYGYGGDSALENPIFVKTNVILAAGWGILYLLVAAWSFLLVRSGLTAYMQFINNGATILMAIFTGWFQNWYPAYIASGKGRKKK